MFIDLEADCQRAPTQVMKVLMKAMDEQWMMEALAQAQKARSLSEVPVGAVVVFDGQVVGAGFNRRETDHDPCAHAEMRAIKEASQSLGRWRLSGGTLYVTLEPCLMCAGAIVLSRLDRVVFGAIDPKGGAVTSLYTVLSDSRLNHRPLITGGIMAEPCGSIISEFFADLRRPDL